MINLCIVGAADVIRDRHGAILREMSDKIRVRCIVSRRPEAVAVIEKRLGYPVIRVDTIDGALKLDIDAVLVTVTPTATIEVASYISRLNIPQYVEKPLASDVISAAKFVQEVTDLKQPVIVGENFQHQKRFTTARTMYEKCGQTTPTHVIAHDTLRRGLRTNVRTDDELFDEQFVHIMSAIRALTGQEVDSIKRVTKQRTGSISEMVSEGTMTGGIRLEIHQRFTNTWSYDHYSLVFPDGDINVSHNFDHERKTYTDTVEHWHGSEDLIELENILDADCGMRGCWKEFFNQLDIKASQPSRSLVDALNDVQAREAVKISLETGKPVPVVAFQQ